MLLLPIFLLFLGFVLLWKGSDWLIDSAVNIANAFAIPAYIIGFTILAFGTSLPELIVNVLASSQGQDAMVLGNVLGSNISNLLLILSLTGLITACTFSFKSFRDKISQSFIAHLIFLAILGTAFLIWRQVDLSALLSLPLILFLIYILFKQKNIQEDTSSKSPFKTKDIAYLALGFGALFLGGKWVVDSATSLADALGLSEAFIALFLVALGTSLPELATSLTGIRKAQHDLVLGNIFGSNVFNLAFILPVSSWIQSISLPRFMLLDILILMAAHAIFFLLWPLKKIHNKRVYWFFIFLTYCCYIIWITLRG